MPPIELEERVSILERRMTGIQERIEKVEESVVTSMGRQDFLAENLRKTLDQHTKTLDQHTVLLKEILDRLN